MAAGIGEASAIATFLQVGLSIATTLNTYIADVRDAPTEVCDLANEINSTLWQVEVLNSLIASNDPSNGWSAKGVVFAQKCLAESEKIINNISTLLQKAGRSEEGATLVTRESIDLKLFSQLRWPTFKPQLEKVKRRLECVRMDICLLCGMHKAICGATKEERDTGSDAVVKFAQSRVTAKRILRKITAMQKGSMPEPHSQRPSRVRIIEPEKRKRKTPRPSGYKIDLGEDMEPMILSGEDSEDVHIQFTSLTAAIREMINDEMQQEETARKKAVEEKQLHEQQILEDYKRSLVEKYTDLERKAADLREQLKRGFEPELPDEQIDSHIKRLQAKELSNDEIIKRIAEMGFRQAGYVEVESDQATLVSTSNRPEGNRLWSQLRRNLKDGDRNPIPMALRQNHSIPGLAKVTSISLSFDGEEWHVVQVNVSMPWLIKRLAGEERKDSKSIGKMSETLRAHAKLPKECRLKAESWLQAAGNRKYAWALLYAHTTKSSVSKPRKLLQKAIFGSAIEAQVDNVLLVFRATRDSHGRSYEDRKEDGDGEREAGGTKTPASRFTTPAAAVEEMADPPTPQASVPKPASESKRAAETANLFSQANQDLPPSAAQSGYYPHAYPYASPMGRPPAPHAGHLPFPPYPPYSPYSPYPGASSQDPTLGSYYPQYPSSSPFSPTGYDEYAPAPPRSRSPPPSTSRPTSHRADPIYSYDDRTNTINIKPRHVYGAPKRPSDGASTSRGTRSVVVHDPWGERVSSSDERRRRSLAASRRPSPSRDCSSRGASPYRRSFSRRSDSDSDSSWFDVNNEPRDDWHSDRTEKTHRRTQSIAMRQRAAASDSGYSSHIGLRDDTDHESPNWVIYRPRRSSSPDVSDDSSNLSLDGKTLKESELRDRLLSKYTTSEVGGSSSRGKADSVGPKIEEVLSENGGDEQLKDEGRYGAVELIEEDLWAGFTTAGRKMEKKQEEKKKAKVTNGDVDEQDRGLGNGGRNGVYVERIDENSG